MSRWFTRPMRWLQREEINGAGTCPTYLYRWNLLRLPFGIAVYLHHFVGDDWSLDPHDHPKTFLVFGLWGSYDEDVYLQEMDHGWLMRPTTRRWRAPWIRFFRADHIHRVRSAHTGGAWTLVFTGPKVREWGFWFRRNWIRWDLYIARHGYDRRDC